MIDLLKLTLGVLTSLFKSRAELDAKILVCGNRVNVLRRRMPKRPPLTNIDHPRRQCHVVLGEELDGRQHHE